MNDGSQLQSLEETLNKIAEALHEKDALFACAESCTGGWVAKSVTDLAGSSAWFDRGFVTYSNAAKRDMLGVLEETLETNGAVSEAVVREMAQGVLVNSLASYSLAVSGIAGPGGGTAEKPVGTVWLAWAGESVDAECFHFEGDRESVRAQAVELALTGLLKRIQ